MLVRVDRIYPAPVRRRRESNIGTYNENPDSYIAGRVPKDDLPYDFTIGDNTTDGDGYYNSPLQNGVTYDIRTGVQSDNGNVVSTDSNVKINFRIMLHNVICDYFKALKLEAL